MTTQTLPVATQKQPKVTGPSRRISELANNLERRLFDSVSNFNRLSIETKFVALNARIEAGRASGVSGRAFDVVAQSIQDISARTGEVADKLGKEFHDLLKEMREITEDLACRTRGERLSSLALANIDLIDRNLYERSCDVRWWATDPSVVEALSNPTPDVLGHTTTRLGQILDSYTVYYDIVLADLEGRIISNGRPTQFRSVDSLQSNQPWFVGALRTSRGTEYVQGDVTQSPLCGGDRTIIFACAVREGGRELGQPIGVLAVVFRWDALAQVIVERTPLSNAEWEHSRACIVDHQGRLLADTSGELGQLLQTPSCSWREMASINLGHRMLTIENNSYCVGHAKSPGYETYKTGWYSLILQAESAS